MFKRKDGLWQDSLTINGRRVTFAGKTQKAVKEKMIKAQKEQKTAETFAGVAEAFWDLRSEQLAPGSLVPYRPALRLAVQHFGDRDLADIKPKDINIYLNSLKNRFATKTISNYRTVINQLFEYAITERGFDIENPCAHVRTPKSNIKAVTRQPLTPEQRAEIDATRPGEFLLAFLIVNTGARLGEACALQWGDVDFDNNLIYITKSAHWNGNAPYIGDLKTKNAARIVPLLFPLRDMLLQQKSRKKADYIVSGRDLLTMSKLEARWLEYCQAHGLAHAVDKTWKTKGTARRHLSWVCDINRHQIRHDYATSLFRAGLPVKTVQHLLGHSDYSTTMNIYVHFQRENVDDARAQIEQYIKENKKSAGQ